MSEEKDIEIFNIINRVLHYESTSNKISNLASLATLLHLSKTDSRWSSMPQLLGLCKSKAMCLDFVFCPSCKYYVECTNNATLNIVLE